MTAFESVFIYSVFFILSICESFILLNEISTFNDNTAIIDFVLNYAIIALLFICNVFVYFEVF